MGNPIYVIAYDVGTTGVKTCLFSITDKIELLGAASEGYNLYVYPDGGAGAGPRRVVGGNAHKHPHGNEKPK